MQKGIIEIGRDFLADFVGLERGVFFTLKKLLFDPLEVVDAYKVKDPRVCTPFSLIMLVFGFFFLVSSVTGTDELLFQKADLLSKVSAIPLISTMVRFVWANLPFLISLFIVLTCSFLGLLTRRLGLSFYDHLVANLYNLAVFMFPVSLIILVMPIADFNPVILNGMMAVLGILTLKMKKLKIRILFYYPEEVREGLKMPMKISGVLMAILLLMPMLLLIITGRI